MTPQDIAYLRSRAQAAGYNADDLLKVIDHESSGRSNVWGGKGNQYFGLFQAGPSERKQFGVDTVNPSATNQIDALFKFLPARGFKAGMGLQDLYSTVLAGSPGHYNRSDGAGTVAQHVARMTGGSAPGGSLSSVPGMSLAYAPWDQEQPPQSIDDLLMQQQGAPAEKPQGIPAGLIGIRQAAQQEEEKQTEYDDEMRRQMKQLHDQIHQASVAGLLGRM